jgi:hypothetical protein
MYDICERCKGEMDATSYRLPLKIGDENPELEYVTYVCKQCREEAKQIDKAFTEACAKAKLQWLRDPNIKLNEITSIQSVKDFRALH